MASLGGHMSHPGHLLSVDRSHVPVSRGMLSGGLLVLLGIWGGLIPFVGPKFDYAYTPDTAWTWTAGRLWLEVIPAVVTILGGLMVAGTKSRATGLLGGWLAALAGAWFVVGTTLSQLWNGGAGHAGTPTGASTAAKVVQEIGFFYGLGAVILFLGALTIGRFGGSQAGVPVEAEEEEEGAPYGGPLR